MAQLPAVRFADVLARRTGQGDGPLDHTTLAQLQSEILGKRTTLQQLRGANAVDQNL